MHTVVVTLGMVTLSILGLQLSAAARVRKDATDTDQFLEPNAANRHRPSQRRVRSVYSNIFPSHARSNSRSRVSGDVAEELDALLTALSPGRVSGNEEKLLLQYSRDLVTSRAIFFSLAMQWQNATQQFEAQPGFLYYYVSAASPLSSAPDILVGSGVLFDSRKHYANWYRGLAFNETMPLFAPYSRRLSHSRFRVNDYGADTIRNYTSTLSAPTDTPQTYTVIRRDRFGDSSHSGFYAAPSATAVKISGPYTACSDDDRILLTFSSSVVDVLARYTVPMWPHLRQPRYVAEVKVDLDVQKLLEDSLQEINDFHNMLVPMLNCPNVPSRPGSNTLPYNFFRTVYPQSRLAVNLAHTLSAFLQIRDELSDSDVIVPQSRWTWYYDSPSASIKLDPVLSDTMLEAEVLAILMADPAILSSDIYVRRWELAGSSPTITHSRHKVYQAQRRPEEPRFSVGDVSDRTYANRLMLGAAKTTWNRPGTDQRLTSFQLQARIRSSVQGGGLADLSDDPLSYRAVSMEHGSWTSPYYKCHNNVNNWVVTYAAPFFGPTDTGELILGGIVTVDVKVTPDNWNPGD